MPKEYFMMLAAVITGFAAIIVAIYNAFITNKKAKRDFKREHNYDQLKELYLFLYGIVTQSEYVRYFFKHHRNIDLSYREYPFLEIQGRTTHYKKGQNEVRIHDDPITEFNKLNIANKIIEKSEYASQRLLKLAVAYRYCHKHYQQNVSTTDGTNLKNSFQSEELKLIYLIVTTIIIECNGLLEECQMSYDGKEVSYGIMNYDVFDDTEY
ncbi:hypothetical protein [Bacillus sp. AG4(2022)]|uniref:hypothetical protein n=1 Tax=Bacillus sp. AG4(2022) TaxID=2962594 RepID=UPI0028816FC0|nr:hypothetical protein [Bacillus sp. AG4(2022)]MDT0161870.1 hypothetical protein [Bacillus sp. AG4(2022)]